MVITTAMSTLWEGGFLFRDKQMDAGAISFCIYIHTYKLENYLRIALTDLIQSVG